MNAVQGIIVTLTVTSAGAGYFKDMGQQRDRILASGLEIDLTDIIAKDNC